MAPPRNRKFGVDPKDYTEQDVAANQQDHGFNHLNIPTSTRAAPDIVTPPTFNFPNTAAETKYLNAVCNKLILVKNFILKERELGLDSDRPGIDKEPTVTLLAQGPIIIGISAQQRVRVLLDDTAQLKRASATKREIDSELQKVMQEYWLSWTEVLAHLTWQVPGKDDKDKESKADAIMTEVFGKLVKL